MARSSLPRSPLRYLLNHRGWIGAGIICLIVTNALAQSIPWLVKHAVAALRAESVAGPASLGVPTLASLIATLAAGQALIRVFSRVFVFNAARNAEYELRRSLFSRLCSADAAFYRRHRTGDLMSRLTNDISAVRGLLGPGVLHATNTVFAYAVALPLMLRIDMSLTLWALAPYPLLLLGAPYLARNIYQHSQALQESLSEMTTAVQEDLTGIREIRTYRREGYFSGRFSGISEAYLQKAMRLARWRAGLIPFVGLGTGASIVIIVWLGGHRIMAGSKASHPLVIGDIIALNLYVGLLAWPTMAMGWMLSLLQRASAAWHRLQQLFGEAAAHPCLSPGSTQHGMPPASTSPAGRMNLSASAPLFDLRHLTVRIDGSPALRDVCWRIEPHRLYGVVGRVGSGKTTLVETLTRLQDLEEGMLYFRGVDVCRLEAETLRAQIAYAPQEAFLFSATLAENIAYGIPEGLPADRRLERVERAAAAAGLAPDLERLPEGLDTLVGERGIALSGGQRQRVALARALAAERPLLLLDDSLSSVDATTEREILSGLSQYFRTSTTLLISHRLSALQDADEILVLEEGGVAQRGHHRDLLGQPGPYATLYRRQLLDQQRRDAPAPVSAAHEPPRAR